MQNNLESILIVNQLPPEQKHPSVFRCFDALQEGESFIIQNDHDPKPLYYQMLGQLGEVFNWEYLEDGPDSWKVRITKRMPGESSETMGQIVARDIRKAQVFRKYGLDFCCGGKRTVKDACSEKGINVRQVETELQQAGETAVSRPLPYNEWNPGFLADFIVNTHHDYVRKNLPVVREYAHKVFHRHGDQHPELERVYELAELIYADMMEHMVKEEEVLFPFIKKLANEGSSMSTGISILQPVTLMEKEHEIVGSAMAEIRTLTSDYTAPANSCASYRLLYHMLEEFEGDLHMHVHLENNILFPAALELEKAQFQ